MNTPAVGDVVQIRVGYRRVNGTVVGVDDGWCRVVVPGPLHAETGSILPLEWHDRLLESVVVQPRPDAGHPTVGETTDA